MIIDNNYEIQNVAGEACATTETLRVVRFMIQILQTLINGAANRTARAHKASAWADAVTYPLST